MISLVKAHVVNRLLEQENRNRPEPVIEDDYAENVLEVKLK